MAGGSISVMEGRSLLDAIMASAQRQALARGLHDRIERCSRKQRAQVLSAREPVTSLTLLQVAAVMGNLQAVKCLLSLGADAHETWQPHAHEEIMREDDKSWFTWPTLMMLMYHLGDETLKKTAFSPGQLAGTTVNVLHLAALAGHEDVVCYLVESGALPVDSGPFTPLMAVMTRRCTLSAQSMRGIQVVKKGRAWATLDYTHLCGRQPAACSGGEFCCRPLLRMAQLLIQLGADATAVHPSRGCLLTIAASAGNWGLWDVLVRNAPDLAADIAARCHAGRVLLGAMDSYMQDGEHNILGSVIAFLQSSFAARGQQQLFLQQVNKPLEAAAHTIGHAANLHMLFGGRVHAMCMALLSTTGRGCKKAVQLLLQAGITPGALKLGRQQYQLEWWSNAEAVLAIVEHAVAGADTQQYGDILVGLLCQCCALDGPKNSSDAGLVAEATRLLAKAGVDVRQERWWPRQFGALFAETWPQLCQAGVPVSPLVFACGTGSTEVVNGMVAALKQMDQHGWAQWISEPAGPRSDEAPLVAIHHGRYQILRDLLDARVTLAPEQHALVLERLRSSGHAPNTQAAVEELRVYLDKHVQQCAHCRKYARCRLCARCRKERYCSRACQLRAWDAHKQSCQEAAM